MDFESSAIRCIETNNIYDSLIHSAVIGVDALAILGRLDPTCVNPSSKRTTISSINHFCLNCHRLFVVDSPRNILCDKLIFEMHTRRRQHKLCGPSNLFNVIGFWGSLVAFHGFCNIDIMDMPLRNGKLLCMPKVICHRSGYHFLCLLEMENCWQCFIFL